MATNTGKNSEHIKPPETTVQTLTHATGAANNGLEKDPKKQDGVYVTHVKGSKAQRAQEIFNEIGASAARRDVIHRFVNEVGLSQSGASTYYQNMKSKAGLVQKRELVTVEVTQFAHQGDAIANNTGTRGNDQQKTGERVGGKQTDAAMAAKN